MCEADEAELVLEHYTALLYCLYIAPIFITCSGSINTDFGISELFDYSAEKDSLV